MTIFIRNKKKYFGLAFLLIFYCSHLFSQRTIDVKYQEDGKGGYVFSCFNNAYCTYILDLGFSTFTNLRSDQPLPYHAEVKPGYNKLFTISAIDAQSTVKFNFGTVNLKGCMHPVVNKDFTYLFPISPGKQAQVYEMSPDKPADSLSSWYVLRLKMKPGDTIYASRKGIINEIQDQNSANDAGLTSAGLENYIEIVQPDCSFAHYGILKKNSAMVKLGQSVNAGQPIGLVGGDVYGRGSEIRLSVFYYIQEMNTSNQETGKRLPLYIPLQIWTKKNGKGKLKHGAEYISEFPAAILNQETPKPAAKKTKTKKK